MSDAPADRETALDQMADAGVDVLVVGGGITGAGVALDAASRGYRVALIERRDIAAGTSSKSSKLVHGGLRYLATGDVTMVAEGVRERERLRRNAPHLVRPLGFVIPVDSVADSLLLRAGMNVYDLLAVGRGVARHRHLRPIDVEGVAPGLRGATRGGFRYYDAQTDDARLTLAILQAARRHGALAANHVAAVELRQGLDGVVGVRVRDELTGAEHDVDARWIIDATGVWAGAVAGVAGTGPELVPAKGVHVVFRRDQVPVRQAVVLPSVRGDGRRVFLIPWGEQVYLGTTDDLYDGTLEAPSVTGEDAAYLLDALNAAFGTSWTAQDAIGAWAGLRPLVAADGASKDLSRRHVVQEGPRRLVTVTGGKLTTYRQMAQDVVDHVVAADGIARRCRTRRLGLGGSEPTAAVRAGLQATLAELGADPSVAGALLHRHGDQAPEVARACAERGEHLRLVPTLPYLVGEVRWAVRHELARTLDDVLSRRLRVALRDAAAGGDGIARAAEVVGDELGWDDAERDRQIAAYLSGVAAERGVVPLRS